MRVRTFIGKVSMEGIRQMDETINAWLKENSVEPKIVNQQYGIDSHHETSSQEPVLITSVWY
jgi:hypothetical protein